MHSTSSLAAFAAPARLPTFTRPRLALTTLAMKRKLTTPEEHAAKRRQAPVPPSISSPHQTPPSPHPPKNRSWTQHQCARVADTVSQELKAIATPEIAASQSVYMRNIVPFYGVKTPERRAATDATVRSFRATATRDDIVALLDTLWAYPEREMQHVALDLLKSSRKTWSPSDGADHPPSPVLACLVRCARDRPWWDTVDMLSPWGFGTLLLSDGAGGETRALMDHWAGSADVWERRVAILCQMRAGDRTDVAWLFDVVKRAAAVDDFFVQKACGWALRNFRREGAEAEERVNLFLDANETSFSSLALREARK